MPFSLAIQEDTIYLGTVGSGIYRSTNGGTDWAEINSGITSKRIWSIYKTSNTIFASSLNGNLYRSTNGGDNWENANNCISSTTIIKEFATYKGKLFGTSTNKGAYMSSDNGTTWATHNSGIGVLVAKALEIANGELYVGVLQSVYKYDDTNQRWVRKSNCKTNQIVSSLKYINDSSSMVNYLLLMGM